MERYIDTTELTYLIRMASSDLRCEMLATLYMNDSES